MDFLKTCFAVLVGFVFATLIYYHPKAVRASGSDVHIKRVDISNAKFVIHPAESIDGSTVVGFSCTTTDCYIASQ